ncbi:2-oxoacid ferredoxin oxidoreductase [Clostridium baratii]|uniref:thiamine pyrophosphate-dependent enzyme n=1 Tax=Clostridium baratii TaxID=1561 RepID=UPI0009A2E061|nr:thiamine pyrophosphate-dependent enzyme [Clostridium baratii]OPF52718.1 2-oxoacid ferredoxin oxidoreductase [Clostridium baratii]OPF56168.1 2-oxoacid ferredoxin oxidoreductase [Clostridium baratii]OPF58237.1 2-oxoacid ferredoxin oxidoreductase [Clostridium baratii]OPF59450.1 2-oxoacid ferredoxin oxidoreductase [Clostridium baratii]
MIELKSFNSNDENTWCPGCGNFAILACIKESLYELGLSPEEVVMVSGIGQAAKTPHYLKANVFNGLHGRALPPAQAIKIVNKNLKVIVTSGDGDAYGEGGNHFLHNIRRNVDIVQLVHNNQIYGLTKGQGSPTTARGQKTSMQFDGTYTDPLNPLALAISLGATFVARSFSGEKEHLKELIKKAINHKGYALIDILQPCVSFNKINTFKWYKDRVYKLDETYNPKDKIEAFKKSQEFGDDGIPIGIFYIDETKKTYAESHPVLESGYNLIDRQWKPTDAQKLLNEFL